MVAAVAAGSCVVVPPPASTSTSPSGSTSTSTTPLAPAPSGSASTPAAPPPAAPAPLGEGPSRQWPLLADGYPTLPTTVEGLLIKATIGRAELIDTARSEINANDDTYILLVPGQRGRIVLGANGVPLGSADVKQRGIMGPAAIVAIDRDVASKQCPANSPHYLCVKKLRRLDAGATYPLDAGVVLAEVLATYVPTAPEGLALAGRAQQGLAQLPIPPGARPAAPRRYPPLAPVSYAVAWSPSSQHLEVLVVARAERSAVRREVSSDPHAGTFGCDAPPGADCAPRCVPPASSITTSYVVEAGVRATFDRTGVRIRLDDAGIGAIAARQVSRVDEPCR